MRSVRQRVLLSAGWALFIVSVVCIVMSLPPMCGLAFLYRWATSGTINPAFHAWLPVAAVFGLPLSVSLIHAASISPERRTVERACPHCGYDLRGRPDAAVCPECGQAV